jgi:hypothetical protein
MEFTPLIPLFHFSKQKKSKINNDKSPTTKE